MWNLSTYYITYIGSRYSYNNDQWLYTGVTLCDIIFQGKKLYIFYTQNEIGMQRDDVFIAFATDYLQTLKANI